jgi:hypothetical protein
MSETESDELEHEIDSFAVPIRTGMRRVVRNASSRIDSAADAEIRRRLEDFDAVRTRGDVESRSVHLGARS